MIYWPPSIRVILRIMRLHPRKVVRCYKNGMRSMNGRNYTAVASEFFKTVESQYADRIETIRGAWPGLVDGWFWFRCPRRPPYLVTHSDIIANQAGLSFAKMLGAQLPTDINDRIQDINKALLFYDEHTFGHSESVRNAYGLETWEQRP